MTDPKDPRSSAQPKLALKFGEVGRQSGGPEANLCDRDQNKINVRVVERVLPCPECQLAAMRRFDCWVGYCQRGLDWFHSLVSLGTSNAWLSDALRPQKP